MIGLIKDVSTSSLSRRCIRYVCIVSDVECKRTSGLVASLLKETILTKKVEFCERMCFSHLFIYISFFLDVYIFFIFVAPSLFGISTKQTYSNLPHRFDLYKHVCRDVFPFTYIVRPYCFSPKA